MFYLSYAANPVLYQLLYKCLSQNSRGFSLINTGSQSLLIKICSVFRSGKRCIVPESYQASHSIIQLSQQKITDKPLPFLSRNFILQLQWNNPSYKVSCSEPAHWSLCTSMTIVKVLWEEASRDIYSLIIKFNMIWYYQELKMTGISDLPNCFLEIQLFQIKIKRLRNTASTLCPRTILWGLPLPCSPLPPPALEITYTHLWC